MTRKAQLERIDEEAALWAARLDGGISDGDRAALAFWLDADPEHRLALARYRELSVRLDVQLGLAADLVAQAHAAARRRRWRWAGALTAAAAAMVVLFAVLTDRRPDFTTKTAERHGAVLADGSRVELNAQTSLVVDFRRDERRVRLVRGEALFSVAKDSERPFIVETPLGLVRVTGTKFNVRTTRESGVDVAVLEGSVRLRAQNAAIGDAAMNSGQRAFMDEKRIAVNTLPEGAMQDVVAWRQGQIVFDDTPLKEAFERFESYDSRKVVVDQAVMDLRLGGRYSLDDLDGLLESIEHVLPVRVLRDGETVRIRAGGAPMR